MTAIVLLMGVEAVFMDGEWTYPDKSNQDMLNATIPQFSGADPNTEQTAAQYVVDNYGGVIVSVDKAESVDGIVY